jgi:Ca-activated chloride channel family protein
MNLILVGFVRGPMYAVRTVGVAFAVAPGVLRAGLWLLRNRKGVSAMPDKNVKREGLVSLVVTALVFFTIVAIGVRIFWPPPPEPTVVVAHWTTGHLTRDGLLKEMAQQFNDAVHRTGSGEKIVIEVYDAPSELQGEYLIELLKFGTRRDLHKETNGYVEKDIPDPTIVTPSSAHWLVKVNYEVGWNVVDPDTAKSIVRPVIGIVTYEDMARCLGWPQRQIGFADIIALKNDPRGWDSYPDCDSGGWGKEPLLAFTDPKTSSTGRSLHLALYSIAANKSPGDLTLADVNDPGVEAYVKGFQRLIDHYLIGTTVLNTKIHQGPLYGHFFIMPEDNLIHLYEGTEKSYMNGVKTTAPPIEESMVMIYPKEGSMPRKNCACIVQAAWVSEEQVEASRRWIEYIREDEQQRTFMAAGFRPGTDLDLNYPGSKISRRFGLDPDEPRVVLNPSETPPEVAAAIDGNWEQVKKPGIVTFVVDTSGSMMGGKLQQAKDGLNRAFDSLAKNSQVRFLSFDDTIHTTIPVGPLRNNKWDIREAVNKMRAGGETALYEAIKAGIEMTTAVPSEGDATRAVVVLTDGIANICRTRLDDIIELGSRFETPIVSFSGCQGAPPALDGRGGSVGTEDLFGVGLALDAPNPVQVFFIGIGEADLNIGRLLSEATGAEYQGVTEKDLAKVLEEFSGYF